MSLRLRLATWWGLLRGSPAPILGGGWLDHPEPESRRAAIKALQAFKRPETVEALLRVLLGDPDPEVRGEAACSLAKVAPPVGPAIQGLLAALRGDSDEDVRTDAAFALGMLEAPAAVPGLVEALSREPESGVRVEIADSLGMIGGPAARAALERCLTDSDPQVVETAREALEEMKR